MLNIKFLLIFLVLLIKFSAFCEGTSDEIERKNFKQEISPMLMFGFPGFYKDSPMIKVLLNEIENNSVGGVLLFSNNIQSSKQLKNLTANIKSASKEKIFIAVDQEGGKIQRLSSKNGFHDTDSPKTVAENFSPSQARVIYEDMASMLFHHGINFNLAPSVDLDNSDSPNPIIGGLERSFSNKADRVVTYAKEFIKAHRKFNILTSIKHFPGHGYAPSDSHKSSVDGTKTTAPSELTPFKKLINENFVDSIMTAHIMNKNIDAKYPATLSKTFLKMLLRKELSYEGVIISDDMQMNAVSKEFTLKDSIIKAIQAGCDILIFSNNTPELREIDDEDTLLNHPDFVTPERVSEIIYNAFKAGQLSQERINESLNRIKALKAQSNLFRNSIIEASVVKTDVKEVSQQHDKKLKNFKASKKLSKRKFKEAQSSDKKRALYRVPKRENQKHLNILSYDLSLKGGLFYPSESKDLLSEKYKNPNFNFVLETNMLLTFGPLVFSFGPSLSYMGNYTEVKYETNGSQTRDSYYALGAHLQTGLKLSLKSFPYLQPLAFASVGYSFLEEEDIGDKKTDEDKENRYGKKQGKMPIFILGAGADVSLYSFIPESYISLSDHRLLKDVLLSFAYKKIIDKSKNELYSLSGHIYEVGFKFLLN